MTVKLGKYHMMCLSYLLTGDIGDLKKVKYVIISTYQRKKLKWLNVRIGRYKR